MTHIRRKVTARMAGKSYVNLSSIPPSVADSAFPRSGRLVIGRRGPTTKRKDCQHSKKEVDSHDGFKQTYAACATFLLSPLRQAKITRNGNNALSQAEHRDPPPCPRRTARETAQRTHALPGAAWTRERTLGHSSA